jgi:hypothetical protein
VGSEVNGREQHFNGAYMGTALDLRKVCSSELLHSSAVNPDTMRLLETSHHFNIGFL